jgi:hypothetical protein
MNKKLSVFCFYFFPKNWSISAKYRASQNMRFWKKYEKERPFKPNAFCKQRRKQNQFKRCAHPETSNATLLENNSEAHDR